MKDNLKIYLQIINYIGLLGRDNGSTQKKGFVLS